MTPTTETWLPVVGYEGLYEVSDLGRVRSLTRHVRHSPAGHQRLIQGRVQRTELLSRRGYVRVGLSDRDGKKRTPVVHNLVLTAFVGPRPDGMEGCHNDGDPRDNRLDNLRWDTPSSNSRDQIRHGTHPAASKTHCPRGHRLAMPNLCRSVRARGARSCLACHRASAAEQRAKRRGEHFDFLAESNAYYERIMRAA